MEHDLELIIARLEILEIEVCNILQNPGNIGNHSFSIFWTPGNIGNLFFPFSGYPGNIGNIGNLIFPIFPYPGNIGNMIFLDFWDFSKKDARRNFTQNGPVFAARSLI